MQLVCYEVDGHRLFLKGTNRKFFENRNKKRKRKKDN